MGVYMVSRRVVEGLPRQGAYGFDRLMCDMLAAGQPVHVQRCDGYWLDIGRPDDYMQAIDEFASMRERFLGE
jgi:NDP-sugar pyrophosphorylase family protein